MPPCRRQVEIDIQLDGLPEKVHSGVSGDNSAAKGSFRDPLRTHHPAAWRSAGLQPVFACRLSFDSGALGVGVASRGRGSERRVPDGVRPRVTN